MSFEVLATVFDETIRPAENLFVKVLQYVIAVVPEILRYYTKNLLTLLNAIGSLLVTLQ